MIEVVAIDNRGAEAELVRLAADFAESRLFTPQQKKRLRFVVEVTGTTLPAPIAREQLARSPGLFKSSQYHFTAMISLLHGFDSAVLQLMHELVHISQIINNRYQISAKKLKQNGVKQLSYQAKWLGKKAGFIDNTAWQERPWEQEAATVGERLASEFMTFIYGTQNSFAPQGHEKGAGKMLRLYELAIALPIAPPKPQALVTPQALATASIMPEAPIFDEFSSDRHLTEPPIPDFGAAPFGAPEADNGGQSDDMLADIDALLSADAMATEQDAPPVNTLNDEDMFGAVPVFDGMSQDMQEGSDQASEQAASDEKQTYVLGIAEPRILKLSVLEAKRQELAERGLLEG